MTTTVFKTIIDEVERKIPDVNGLVATAVLNAKFEKSRTRHLVLVIPSGKRKYFSVRQNI